MAGRPFAVSRASTSCPVRTRLTGAPSWTRRRSWVRIGEGQKSSFSEDEDAPNCLEIAATPEAVHLRESEEPGRVVRTTPAGLAALIRALRARVTAASPGPRRRPPPSSRRS
ncbi:DUF397 domain-containing protein [Streptomyces scabiei]|uniref:DUF397 domain-containing protein n=1 Tax=Streptomyces scabiei TaxID=1930 RepID=UPI002D21859C|nr:DUF397 domain-containing protein [Streptomyces scabiei]